MRCPKAWDILATFYLTLSYQHDRTYGRWMAVTVTPANWIGRSNEPGIPSPAEISVDIHLPIFQERKMSKKEFNDLINYMRNRPGERDRLIEALGLGQASPMEGSSKTSAIKHGVAAKSITWVTVRQAGEAIGRSGKWVREHMHLFPSAMKTREGRGSWKYLLQLDEVTAQYEHYLYMMRV